ncbi:MAG TPA: HAMP domain-containing sensor histidine kinase [Marmoricola sp.]
MTSLRSRMVATSVLATTMMMVLLVFLAQDLLSHASQADARSLARARAEGVKASISISGGQVRLLEGRTDTFDRSAWVFSAGGRLRDGRVPSALAPTARVLARSHRSAYRAARGYLLYAQPLSWRGHPVAAVVASVDLRPYETSEQRGLWLAVALGLVTIAVAGVVAHEVTRRSLGAVHRMAETADSWREHDPDRRFGLGPPVDEITELGQTLDQMLDRISSALAAERRLTDEVAHELRTPLTVIRAEAQLAQIRLGPQGQEALTSIVEATRRMEESLRTLLDAARARDLGEGSADLHDTLAPMLEGLDVPTSWQGPTQVQVKVAPELLRSLVAPLLDNARQHARTSVRLEVRPGDPVAVHVRDDGPGVAPEHLETVFEPGWSSREGGTGLGLAVVRRLASTAAVRVEAVPDEGGHFLLRLPAAGHA